MASSHWTWICLFFSVEEAEFLTFANSETELEKPTENIWYCRSIKKNLIYKVSQKHLYF